MLAVAFHRPLSGGQRTEASDEVKRSDLTGSVLSCLVAGGLVVGVVWPLLTVAALEVETIVVNLFEQQGASLSVLPFLRSLTLLAPLPLAILIGLGLGGRIAQIPGGANPLASLPEGAQSLLAILASTLFVVGSLPLAVALSSWVALEAYEWIEWLYDLNPTMEAVFAGVPALFLPGAWLLAFRGSRWAFGPGQPIRTPPGRLQRLVKPFSQGLAAMCVLATAGVGCAVAPQLVRIVTAPSSKPFEEHCGSCHFRTAALNFKRTPEAWSRSLATMQELAGGTIPAEELQDIERWLVAVRSRSPNSVFHSHCSRCHGLSSRRWEARSEEDWAFLVERVSRWSPVFYGPEVRRTLTEELVRRRGDEGAELGLGPERWSRSLEVIRRCGVCHSISWNADRYREDGMEAALPLVERMNQKMVDRLEPRELEQLARDYLELIEDPREFERLVPHDRPLPEPVGGDYQERRPERGGNY
jgi:mono/diheme cytochrome c family protein